MKNFIYLLILYLVVGMSCKVWAQNIGQEEIDFLRNMKKSVESKEKKKYDQWIKEIHASLIRADLLTQNIELIRQKIQDNENHQKIAEMINPSSTSLTGKSYNDYIFEQASNIFITGEKKFKNDSARYTEALRNLTAPEGNEKPTIVGGILQTVLNASPVTNLIGKVVGSVSSWFKTSKKGKKIRSISIAFKKEKLKKFQDALKDYVQFYESSFSLNQELGDDIEKFLLEIKTLQAEINASHKNLKNFITEAGLVMNVGEEVLKNKFPFVLNDFLSEDYNELFVKILDEAKKMEAIRGKAEIFQKETEKVIGRYFEGMDNLTQHFKDKIPNANESLKSIGKNAKMFVLNNNASFKLKDNNLGSLSPLIESQTVGLNIYKFDTSSFKEFQEKMSSDEFEKFISNIKVDYSTITIF